MELLACLLVAMFLFKKENIVLLLVCLFLVAIFQIAKYFSPEYGLYVVFTMLALFCVYAIYFDWQQKKERKRLEQIAKEATEQLVRQQKSNEEFLAAYERYEKMLKQIDSHKKYH